MSYGKLALAMLGFAAALVVSPVVLAQKPPPPPPPPPPGGGTTTPTTRPGINPDPGSVVPDTDLVMYLFGRVATSDGSAIPSSMMVERICNNRVRQQVYPYSKGDFTMQLGSQVGNFVDASGDATPDRSQIRSANQANQNVDQGIPRRDLMDCDLRATAPGFRPVLVSLLGLDPVAKSVDVGVLVVSRTEKVEGMTVSAIPFKAPPDARKAYEKGLEASKRGKAAEARRYFERAVALYPQFAHAWFELGRVLQKDNEADAAGKAYARAAEIDNKFARPYLALAGMAYDAGKWSDVLSLTRHLLDLDPFGQRGIGGYVLDLDPVDYAEAYFYDAFANYKLNRFDEAEKSALKTERMDLRPRFPQVHLLLGELSARKGHYDNAISEMKTYLEKAPGGRDAVRVRERLAELEKLSGAVATTEKPTPQ